MGGWDFGRVGDILGDLELGIWDFARGGIHFRCGSRHGTKSMKYILIGMVRIYQGLSAPVYALFGGAVSGCRFTPTCSRYAVEALEVHGAWHGSCLTLKRVCRCHPWGGLGFDPVPPREIHFREQD